MEEGRVEALAAARVGGGAEVVVAAARVVLAVAMAEVARAKEVVASAVEVAGGAKEVVARAAVAKVVAMEAVWVVAVVAGLEEGFLEVGGRAVAWASAAAVRVVGTEEGVMVGARAAAVVGEVMEAAAMAAAAMVADWAAVERAVEERAGDSDEVVGRVVRRAARLAEGATATVVAEEV